MDVYISLGLGDNYRLSKTRKDSSDDKKFGSYDALIDFFKGDNAEAKRLRAREVLIFADGFSQERRESLKADLQNTGMRKLLGVQTI